MDLGLETHTSVGQNMSDNTVICIPSSNRTFPKENPRQISANVLIISQSDLLLFSTCISGRDLECLPKHLKKSLIAWKGMKTPSKFAYILCSDFLECKEKIKIGEEKTYFSMVRPCISVQEITQEDPTPTQNGCDKAACANQKQFLKVQRCVSQHAASF